MDYLCELDYMDYTICGLYIMSIIYVDYICRRYLVYIICRLYMMISGVICGLYMGTYVRCIYDYVSPKCKTLFSLRYPTNSQKD